MSAGEPPGEPLGPPPLASTTSGEAAAGAPAGCSEGPPEDLVGPSGCASAVPVTIITGLLGAGKTTLLRRLLRSPKGPRLLLIQNEFSEQMGIEAPTLVEAPTLQPQQQQQPRKQQQQEEEEKDAAPVVALTGGEDGLPETLPFGRLVELPGGCLCCSLKGELLQALDGLLSLLHARVDAILVEANGAADPQPIVEALWTDGPLQAKATLDGVVCLVDASHPHAALTAAHPAAAAAAADGAGGRGAEAAWGEGSQRGAPSLESHGGLGIVALKQLALADSILLTKVDVAAEEQQQLLQQQLARLNPGAPINRCCRGEAPLHAVFGLGAYSPDRSSTSFLGASPSSAASEAAAAAAACGMCGTQQQQHSCDAERGCCHHVIGGLASLMLSFPVGRGASPPAGGSSGQTGGAPLCLFSLQLLQQAIGELLWPEEAADTSAAAAAAAADNAAAAAAADAAGQTEAAIFRCKGLFPAWNDTPGDDEEDKRPWGVYELQGVGRSFEVRPVEPTSAAAAAVAAAADGSRQAEARFLFVGVGLDQQQLRRKLLACLVTALEEKK
ncbi:hypothetical protein Efla_003723 [Eimeria flavescens]